MELPTFDEAAGRVENGVGTALDKFIYDQEPAGEAHEREFREGLAAVLAAREAEIEDASAAMGLLKRAIGLLKKARHHLDMHGQEYGHPRQNALISEIDMTTQGWKP